jgi:hypothetical protein
VDASFIRYRQGNDERLTEGLGRALEGKEVLEV